MPDAERDSPTPYTPCTDCSRDCEMWEEGNPNGMLRRS